MTRVKKINEKQFVLDCVNKEFEIIGNPLHWDTFEELRSWANLPENNRWFDNYEMSREQYEEFKKYFLAHFYNWKPKRYSIRDAEQTFAWFSLCWGFNINDNE